MILISVNLMILSALFPVNAKVSISGKAGVQSAKEIEVIDFPANFNGFAYQGCQVYEKGESDWIQLTDSLWTEKIWPVDCVENRSGNNKQYKFMPYYGNQIAEPDSFTHFVSIVVDCRLQKPTGLKIILIK